MYSETSKNTISTEDALDDLILELSLASAMPFGVGGTNFIQATSSSNSLACHAQNMEPKKLKKLEHSVGPLLTLMRTNIDDPVASKASQALRTLMSSRVCISRFIELDGVEIISKIFQQLLQSGGGKRLDLKETSTQRNLVEHCAACYREVGRYYPWKIVHAGVLQQLVVILRHGNVPLQTIAAGTIAVLSMELEICKLLFTNGCIKPLLNVADGDITNEACMLAAVGSITQLCRISEIGLRVFKQGALPILEKSLLRDHGLCFELIREKALNALSWLSRIPEVKPKLLTDKILFGMKREIMHGTIPSQTTVLQMMLNLHNCYSQEKTFTEYVREEIIRILNFGPWHAKNLCAKCICVLFRNEANKLYMAEHNVMEALLAVITEKSMDLQEAPLVSLLCIISHPRVPFQFLALGGHKIIGNLLLCEDEIIRDISIVFLKALSIYNKAAVDSAIPEFKEHLMEVNSDIPQKFGFEYGGMIQEYLQQIVENRRESHYLLDNFSPEEIEEFQLTPQELQAYQDGFMELDPTCKGTLDIDGLKVLMATMGTDLEDEESQELLEKYNVSGSGTLSFKEFLVLMRDWQTKFGTGWNKLLNTTTQRGVVGRARRKGKQILNTRADERRAVNAAKAKRREEMEERKDLAAEHWEAEKLRIKRENEAKLRASQGSRRPR